MTEKKSSLKTDSLIQSIKDKIATGQEREYSYSVNSDGICKFTKTRHLISDGESQTPMEQHWVEYVDLKIYNKVIKKFNENKKKCDTAIKQLLPLIAKLEASLGDFDLKAYEKASRQTQEYDALQKYKSQLETVQLQKKDIAEWRKIYEEAKKDLDELPLKPLKSKEIL